jgi:hypothetical protein
MENVYAIDSIKFYGVSNKKDSSRWYLKEIVTEKNSDSTGESRYRVECFMSKDTNLGWAPFNYFFYLQNTYYINEIRGGQIITSLVFPVLRGRKWNVNMFTSLEQEMANYTFVGKPWMLYTDCAEMVLREEVNVIEEFVYKKVYAKNIGLVNKVESQIYINQDKKNGWSVRQMLIN